MIKDNIERLSKKRKDELAVMRRRCIILTNSKFLERKAKKKRDVEDLNIIKLEEKRFNEINNVITITPIFRIDCKTFFKDTPKLRISCVQLNRNWKGLFVY